MRPHLSDKEKRNEMLIIRITQEEKIRLKSLAKRGKFACMSDYIRSRIFKHSDRKVISLDENANDQLKNLDYELNKIGVNLNQLSKRVNSFSGYRVDDSDRLLLKQAFDLMRQCLILLQKYLR